MKLCCFSFLLLSNIVLAQNVISGDSEPVKLSIGSPSSQSSAIVVKPGQKIQGTSEKVYLLFGKEEVKSFGANSTPVQLKIGSPQSNEAGVPQQTQTARPNKEVRSVSTTQATSENANVISGAPNYYSLFIGIDKYQFTSPSLPNLDKPVNDATSFKNVLLTNYSFPESNSVFLKNPTRADILKALEDLATKVTTKDNLLIFYAGHGYWDERLKVGYWLPADSKTGDKSSWIANSTIRDYIAGIESKHTLLVTDACFSGSIFKTREVTSEINEYGVAKIYQLPSRKAMTSGTLTTVPDESKFMEYLVKRLTDNTSKYLTTRQLFSSVETAVLNNTNTVPQLGVIQETGDEGGDFVFIKK